MQAKVAKAWLHQRGPLKSQERRLPKEIATHGWKKVNALEAVIAPTSTRNQKGAKTEADQRAPEEKEKEKAERKESPDPQLDARIVLQQIAIGRRLPEGLHQVERPTNQSAGFM